MSDGIILRQGINSTSDNNEIQGNLNISGDTVVGGIISGDGSGLTNIPISGTTNLQNTLDGKTENIYFTAHTGDTTIHYTKSSINLSDLGSSAHTHPISEVVNLQTELDNKLETTTFNTYSGSVQTELDGKVETSLFNTYTGNTETTLNTKIETASNVGSGEGIFSGKSGTDLQFKTLTSTGATVTITSTGSTINLESSGGGGSSPWVDTGASISYSGHGDYVEFKNDYFQIAPDSTSNTLGTFQNQAVYVGTGITAGSAAGTITRSMVLGSTLTVAGTSNVTDSYVHGNSITLKGGNRAFILGNNIDMLTVTNSFVGGNTINGGTSASVTNSFVWNSSSAVTTLNDTSTGLILIGQSSFGFKGDNIMGLGGDHYSTLATLSGHYAIGNRIRGTVNDQVVLGIGAQNTYLQLASGAANGVHLGVASTRASFGIVKATAKSLASPATNTAGLAYLGTGLPVALNVANTGDGAFWIEDAITAPTANVANAGALYNSGGTITWWDGTTNYNLTSTGGGGTSYWEETTSAVKIDTAETTKHVVEINTGAAAVTYGGSYSQGNLVVGDGHTFGGSSNTVRRSFIGGSSCIVGTTDSYQKSIGFGQTLIIQGDEDAVFGSGNTVVGDRNFTANNGVNIYGTSNANLGPLNNIGTVSTANNNTVTIGQSLTARGDDQILIGKSFSTSVSTVKGIYIGLDGGRASAGFFQDALLGTGMNFAIGGDQTMRSLGVIQDGSGKGIFYLNNYTGGTISEPTVDIGDSVAMWAKKRSDDVVGLLVKDESGEKSWIGGRIGVGIIDPTEALEVSGNTVISGTLNVGSVGGTASVTNLGIDSSGNVVSGSTGPDSITFEIFNTSPASPDPYTIYDDGNIRLLFDEAATDDIEILILTNPSTGPVHVVWSEPTAGTSGSANVNIASGQTPLNTEVAPDDVVDFVIWAPQDSSYPYYEAKVTVSNATFTSSPAVARVSKWNSPS